MRKRVLFAIYYIVVFLVCAVNCFYMLKSTLFFDISSLPKGKYCYSVESPDGEIILNVYKVENNICSSVRIEAVKSEEKKNIFWQTNADTVDLVWLNQDEISVNNMLINVAEGGTYDCRQGTAIFMEGSFFVEEDSNA